MTNQSILLLGAGRMAQSLTYDLHADYELTIADINTDALDHLGATYKVATQKLDVSDTVALTEIVQPFDLVIGAVPGFLAHQMLETVVKAGKRLVDISFGAESPLEFDQLAKEHGSLAIVDIGVAPGMSNLILGYHADKMEVESFTCLVGGLPIARHWPFSYKAPFSPIDVIEEYIRPSRIIRNGKVTTVPALSAPEFMEVPGIGTLEGFITDGLRTLIDTVPIPNMVEKTLRYPGHRALMQAFRETGFFNIEPVDVRGQKVRPIDVTSKLLLPKWELGEEEPEFTVMQVRVTGTENGKAITHQYDLLDHRDPETGLSSMARTTGFTCAAAARMVLEGKYDHTGIHPPEFVAKENGCFDFILNRLKEQGVIWKYSAL